MQQKNIALLAIGILVFAGFLITSISSFLMARSHTIDTLIKTELPLARDTIFSEVQRDLLTPKVVSSVMADDVLLKEWIKSEKKNVPLIKQYLKEIAENYDAFTATLAVNESLNYYYPEGETIKMSPDNPDDKWFFRVQNSFKRIEFNIAYAANDNGAKDRLTLFINVRVLNDDNEFIGAVGLGLNIDSLKGMLERYRETYGNDVYFITQEGDIFLHEDDSMQGVSIYELAGIKAFANDVLSYESGEYRYHNENGEILLNTRYIEDVGLTLAVEANLGVIANDTFRSLLSNLAISALISAIVGFLLLKVIKSNQRQLESFAWWDQLTGIYNRQAFVRDYDNAIKSHALASHSLYLMMIDIDHFKLVNDEYGHLVGDSVLKKVAQILEEEMPKKSLLARWGGEEFVMTFPSDNAADADKVYQRLASVIANSKAIAELISTQVTVSAGCIKVDASKDLNGNLEAADKYLYAAKAQGRNKIIIGDGLVHL